MIARCLLTIVSSAFLTGTVSKQCRLLATYYSASLCSSSSTGGHETLGRAVPLTQRHNLRTWNGRQDGKRVSL
ncbi:hypothetical protein QBC34DRAFT_397617 [Podospora aff. communis PSN243]|uniref:Secreted protein n=1 Tax=Podospora aff. communis PSN243 TaxID=3040156 RepID=A0AAV9GWE6_9PEZI|nr:hypothetical protein QBC34DRAFT_397617 [Podospora aff. communis PSN243]